MLHSRVKGISGMRDVNNVQYIQWGNTKYIYRHKGQSNCSLRDSNKSNAI